MNCWTLNDISDCSIWVIVFIRSVIKPSTGGWDVNICACSELFLSSTSYPLSSIVTPAPAVTSHIPPLHHTQVTGQLWRQLILNVVSSPRSRWSRVVSLSPSKHGEEVLVQTSLSSRSVSSVVRTQSELEESLVISCQLHLHSQHLALGQVSWYHSLAIVSSHLIRSGLTQIIGITTYTTHTLCRFILFKLIPACVSILPLFLSHCLPNPPQLVSWSLTFVGVSKPYLHIVDLPGGCLSLPWDQVCEASVIRKIVNIVLHHWLRTESMCEHACSVVSGGIPADSPPPARATLMSYLP